MGFLESIKKMIADHPVHTEELRVLEEEEIEEIDVVEEERIVPVVEERERQLHESDEMVITEVRPHKMSRKELFEMIWEDVTRVRGE